MTDLPATKLAELIEKARAFATPVTAPPPQFERYVEIHPTTILALAEEILRRRAEEARPGQLAKIPLERQERG
jgi:hypothetical protein